MAGKSDGAFDILRTTPWLTDQGLLGIVLCAHGAVKNAGGLYSVRALLGLFVSLPHAVGRRKAALT